MSASSAALVDKGRVEPSDTIDLERLDEAVDRMQRRVPQEPYIATIYSERPYQLPNAPNPAEYCTFIYRDQIDSLIQLEPMLEVQPSSSTSQMAPKTGSTAPSATSTPQMGPSNRKKMTLADYAKKKAGQAVTPKPGPEERIADSKACDPPPAPPSEESSKGPSVGYGSRRRPAEEEASPKSPKKPHREELPDSNREVLEVPASIPRQRLPGWLPESHPSTAAKPTIQSASRATSSSTSPFSLSLPSSGASGTADSATTISSKPSPTSKNARKIPGKSAERLRKTPQTEKPEGGISTTRISSTSKLPPRKHSPPNKTTPSKPSNANTGQKHDAPSQEAEEQQQPVPKRVRTIEKERRASAASTSQSASTSASGTPNQLPDRRDTAWQHWKDERKRFQQLAIELRNAYLASSSEADENRDKNLAVGSNVDFPQACILQGLEAALCYMQAAAAQDEARPECKTWQNIVKVLEELAARAASSQDLPHQQLLGLCHLLRSTCAQRVVSLVSMSKGPSGKNADAANIIYEEYLLMRASSKIARESAQKSHDILTRRILKDASSKAHGMGEQLPLHGMAHPMAVVRVAKGMMMDHNKRHELEWKPRIDEGLCKRLH